MFLVGSMTSPNQNVERSIQAEQSSLASPQTNIRGSLFILDYAEKLMVATLSVVAEAAAVENALRSSSVIV